MRKSLIYTALVIPLFCFIACKKDNNNQPQTLIVGKWNMQRIHYVDYLGNVKQQDTQDTVDLASNFSNRVQFNTDGSFTNIYIHNGIYDTIAGSYKANGNVLTFPSYHSNFVFMPTPFPLFLPAVPNITTSNQITQITTTSLVIHSEANMYDSASTIDTKIITDQYYTK